MFQERRLLLVNYSELLPVLLKDKISSIFFVFCCMVLGIEPTALRVLSKHSRTELYPSTNRQNLKRLFNELRIGSLLLLKELLLYKIVKITQAVTFSLSYNPKHFRAKFRV